MNLLSQTFTEILRIKYLDLVNQNWQRFPCQNSHPLIGLLDFVPLFIWQCVSKLVAYINCPVNSQVENLLCRAVTLFSITDTYDCQLTG